MIAYLNIEEDKSKLTRLLKVQRAITKYKSEYIILKLRKIIQNTKKILLFSSSQIT
jgi:hypothetical protein